jgi:predicted PurR-regulated permease PerM
MVTVEGGLPRGDQAMLAIPYLGVFLALLPHIVTTNVIFQKIVGKRLRLNPLAVTLALLFWAWIWGAMGLILAVPLVAMAKIICDYTDSLCGFGAWLGD